MSVVMSLVWMSFTLATFPLRITYRVYVTLPLLLFRFVYTTVCVYLTITFEVLLRKSPLFRQFIRQLKSLAVTLSEVVETKPSQSIRWIIVTILEVILAYFYSFFESKESKGISKQLSYDLVSYEEDDVYDENTPDIKSILDRRDRANKYMHHYIPLHTFRATVRSKSQKRSYFGLRGDETDIETLCSPASFPSTPCSLAKVLTRSSGRVDDVMYMARDKLRMNESYKSTDSVSKTIASEARQSGKVSAAAFDPVFVSNGLYLSSGNHCAQKLGSGLCNSCRSTVAVLPDTFIYFEFSLMTSSDNASPLIAIGLAPPDCPLNVMVGSWPQSVGLCSDGNIIVNSRWSNNTSNASVKPGDTIGALVKLPCASPRAYTRDGSDSDDDDDYLTSNPFEALLAAGRYIGLFPAHAGSPSQVASAIEESPEKASSASPPFLCFNVNGKVLRFAEQVEESVRTELKANPPLYPTVSLLSENTKLWCRFDKGDIVCYSRKSIGAPLGQRVYCLDGTLLLSETDN